MTLGQIGNLNPKVWGITLEFKVLEKGEVRNVNFKDGTEHKVSEDLVGDETGTILLNLWDDSIKKIELGKTYELTEARMTVFNSIMKITMSRKSELNEIKKEITPLLENNMSEKKFKSAKKYPQRKTLKHYF